jgi:CheY-like chemotaxis protein
VHLSQTIMNLISNAAEVMVDGGIISITTCQKYIDKPLKGHREFKKGDYVFLAVSDTGTGISPEDIDRIFEPFYTKKKLGKSGTGLGLAVVWGTVQDHKGYIYVDSKMGKGTTFNLYFPITHQKLEDNRSETSLRMLRGNGETILVVDDEEEQREAMNLILLQLSYLVRTIPSGEEAVKYLKKTPVDLVVLDMIMDPGIGGLETYKRIIQIYPHQKTIIISGYSETEDVREMQRLGAGVYLKKPYAIEKLAKVIKNELKKNIKN